MHQSTLIWILVLAVMLALLGVVITLAESTDVFANTTWLGPIVIIVALCIMGGVSLMFWIREETRPPSSMHPNVNYIDTNNAILSTNVKFDRNGRYGSLQGPPGYPVFFSAGGYFDTDRVFLSGRPGDPIPYWTVDYSNWVTSREKFA